MEEGLTVTKKEIAKSIADNCEITTTLAVKIVQQVFDHIVATLTEEGRIELRNFGVFEVRRRRARQARNPRTGEQVSVPAKLVVTFKPGLEMEEKVRATDKIANGAGKVLVR
jgi:integration host factor subunit beta